MTDIAPPRTRIDDDKFMAVWARMDPELKSECLRMEKEMLQGQAILKDRALGRPKNDRTGFFGIEQATAEVYRLEQVPRKAAELAKAREHLSKLSASLAEDDARFERENEMHAALQPYREYAASKGKTLAQLFREYSEIENALRKDLIDGIFMICDREGIDPIQLFMSVSKFPSDKITVTH